jgi:hypothetical protein
MLIWGEHTQLGWRILTQDGYGNLDRIRNEDVNSTEIFLITLKNKRKWRKMEVASAKNLLDPHF